MERGLQIRDVLFGGQCMFFAAMMALMGSHFFPLCAGFGAAGTGVLLLTLVSREPLMRKLSYAVAGGAGAAAAVTLAVFFTLLWLGRPPAGDGGGITVPMLLIICPAAFLVGVAGIAVCRLSTPRAMTGKGD